MAATRRRSIPPLIRALEAEPWRFDVYQAVRILEQARGLEHSDPGAEERLSPSAEAPPRAVPVGETGDPRREAVRFTADPSLRFPASAIEAIGEAERPDRPRPMATRFLGLAGALGPLPRPVTERLLDRQAKKDRAWRAFLDIFNHRLISLMVRVKKAHRLSLETRAPHRSGLARYLFSLMGLGTPGLRDRMTTPDRALVRYSGLLAHRPRTAAGLEQMFRDYYDAPMRLAQFQGAWFRLDEDQWTRLGRANSVLGESAVLGGRFWEQQAGIELVIGPLTYERFVEFLPGGVANRPLLSMVLFYVSPEFNFTARLVLKAESVPEMRLGQDLRLGWTTWLKTRPFAGDDDQVRITIRDQSALTRL